MVRSGLVMAWRLATWPTSRSPVLVKATTDGVVRWPSALGITVGFPPSMTATHELVVPRSMPMILPIVLSFRYDDFGVLQVPALELVTLLNHVDDPVFRDGVALLLHERVMHVGIELLAHGV